MEKAEARRRIKLTVAGIAPEERRECSAAAACRLFEMREYRQAEVVMVFVSMPDEIDTSRIITQALEDGKRVAAPKVNRTARSMEAFEITDPATQLRPAAMGILTPVTNRIVPAGELDFILVPARVVDMQGCRLGRGGGYYDRYMSRPGFGAFKCVYIYDLQVLGSVPCSGHDVPVDASVTEKRVLRFRDLES